MLLEKIENDLKDGMRAKDTMKTDTLRMMKSALNYYKIEKRKDEVTDEDVLTIIARQIKQHKESIESFEKGGRQDLIDKEKKELAILESYMPKQASTEEVKKIILAAIQETGAAGKKDFGKVMKLVTTQLKSQADGKVISQIVGEELTKKETAA
jgi:uncharacterized protein